MPGLRVVFAWPTRGLSAFHFEVPERGVAHTWPTRGPRVPYAWPTRGLCVAYAWPPCGFCNLKFNFGVLRLIPSFLSRRDLGFRVCFRAIVHNLGFCFGLEADRAQPKIAKTENPSS
jgi:hypothetical protein